MAQKVHDVMTADPLVLPAGASVADAALAMRESDVGCVLVEESGALLGIVTDRDLVVRGLARGVDPRRLRLADVCSREVVTVQPEDDAEEAIRKMRERAVRRVPVTKHGRPVGILSLGDLALRRDPESLLGAIVTAAPNR